ncbi:MAG: hypothetical protein DRI61_02620 [Chloroflexi bacterium]|nr:MAG: hypothetical protein DRI61_02620 [Chloroflexota bacterium]
MRRLYKDNNLILLLFVSFRLMMLATFLPEDLTMFGDYSYYYQLASLSDKGFIPFIHYWSEHLPVFPFLSIGIYKMAKLFGGGYGSYARLLGLTMLIFDAGNLWLLMRLAKRIYGEEKSILLGWVYSLLFVPLIFAWWTFEPMTAFFILLSLEFLFSGKEGFSAIMVGLGAMTKLIPMLVMPAVIRVCSSRLKYVTTVAITVGFIAGTLLLAGGEMAMASFLSPLARSSYQTVWALMDGNLGTGLLGSVEKHFDLRYAFTPAGNPPRFPEWLKALVFGLLYLLLYRKVRFENAPRDVINLVTLTITVFLLWSKGWSPQWQVFLFPLILLMMPGYKGVLYILVLSFVNLMEWPLALGHNLNHLLPMTVLLRTAIFLLLLVECMKIRA